jgi:hypothetical protein
MGHVNDGPTLPARRMHGRGNNWPCAGLAGDSLPPLCRALGRGWWGAGRWPGTDYHYAGSSEGWQTRPREDSTGVEITASGLSRYIGKLRRTVTQAQARLESFKLPPPCRASPSGRAGARYPFCGDTPGRPIPIGRSGHRQPGFKFQVGGRSARPRRRASRTVPT